MSLVNYFQNFLHVVGAPRACLKNPVGAVFGEKAVWLGASAGARPLMENTLHGSSTEEQQSRRVVFGETLRAEALLVWLVVAPPSQILKDMTKSLSEKSGGRCFWGKGLMARRDEVEYTSWVFD